MVEGRSTPDHRSESPPLSDDLLESAALSLQLDAHTAPHLDDAAFGARF